MPRRVNLTAFLFPTVMLACVLIQTTSAIASDGPEIKSGQFHTWEMPDMPNINVKGKKEPCRFGFWIPRDYTPDRPFPLLVFLAGSEGSAHPGMPRNLIGESGWVVAALPYPWQCFAGDRQHLNGNHGLMWEVHKHMLNKLMEKVPNIHPTVRVIGGFSNGGHSICNLLKKSDEFGQFFKVFFIIEGGAGTAFKNHEGHPILVGWGTSSSHGKGMANGVLGSARAANMLITEMPMEGADHEFPQQYWGETAKWIRETVLPWALTYDAERLPELAKKSKTYPEAIPVAKALIASAEKESKPELAEKAKEILAAIEKEASEDVERILPEESEELSSSMRKSYSKKIGKFLETYAGTEAGNKAQGVLDQFNAKTYLEDLPKMARSKRDLPEAISACKFLAEYGESQKRTDMVELAAATMKEIEEKAEKDLQKAMPKEGKELSTKSAEKYVKKLNKWLETYAGTEAAKAALSKIKELSTIED